MYKGRQLRKPLPAYFYDKQAGYARVYTEFQQNSTLTN